MDNGNGNGLSASDVALMTGAGNGWGNSFGGNGFEGIIYLIAILALFGGGFGGFGGGFGGNNMMAYDLFGYRPQYATQDFVQNGFNFNNLLDGNRDIMNAIQRDTYDTITAIKDGNAATIREFGNVEMGLQNLSATTQQCCCDIQRNIDSVNYNQAMNTAAINKNTTEQTQRILDAIQQNRMDDMQNRINQLELQNQLGNVVRYPNGFTYNAGASPFCNCNPCCNV